MNELKLIVELSPADRERVDRALGLLEKLAGGHSCSCAAEKPEPKKAPKTTAKKPTKAEAEAAVTQAATKVVTETPKPAEAPQLPVEEPVHENQPVSAPMLSLPELQKLITTACVAHPDKKAAIRDVVKAYGANVSSIPGDKRAEVKAKLEEIL